MKSWQKLLADMQAQILEKSRIVRKAKLEDHKELRKSANKILRRFGSDLPNAYANWASRAVARGAGNMPKVSAIPVAGGPAVTGHVTGGGSR